MTPGGCIGRRVRGEPPPGLVDFRAAVARLVPLELAEPARHLALEVAVGPAEPVEAAGAPVERVNAGERVDERVAHARAPRSGITGQRRRHRLAHDDAVHACIK